jgi:hypothetical protein
VVAKVEWNMEIMKPWGKERLFSTQKQSFKQCRGCLISKKNLKFEFREVLEKAFLLYPHLWLIPLKKLSLN